MWFLLIKSLYFYQVHRVLRLTSFRISHIMSVSDGTRVLFTRAKCTSYSTIQDKDSFTILKKTPKITKQLIFPLLFEDFWQFLEIWKFVKESLSWVVLYDYAYDSPRSRQIGENDLKPDKMYKFTKITLFFISLAILGYFLPIIFLNIFSIFIIFMGFF